MIFSLTHKSIVLLLSILLIILAFFSKGIPYFSSDLLITRQLQTIDIPWFHNAMVYVSLLGYFPWMPIFIACTLIFLIFKRKIREAFCVIFASIFPGIIGYLLKYIVSRPRALDSFINVEIVGVGNDKYSFPAGHVFFFTSIYGFILYLVFKKTTNVFLRALSSIIFGGLIVLIGISRIYLGAHWPSDVIGGYIIGIITLLISINFYNNFHLKDFKYGKKK